MLVSELAAKLGLEVDEVAFEKGEAAIHGLHHGFLAFASAAVAGLAVVGAAFAKSTVNATLAASRLAQSTGVPLDTIQELGFAFEASGVSVDTLAIGMRHLARTGVKDIGAEMLKLSERFKDMPDDGAKVKLAIDKFGRSGALLIPTLNKGKEALQELMEEAQALGLVFSEEDVAASKEFQKELHTLEATFTGMKYQIGKALIPALTKLLEAMGKAARWLTQLPKTLKENVQWVKAFALALGTVAVAAILANASAIIYALSWYVALGVAAIATAAKAALAWIAAAAPFFALVLAIGAVVLVLEDLYQFFTGGDSVTGELVEKWKAQFGSWQDFLRDLWAWVKEMLGTVWDSATRPLAAAIAGWKALFSEFWGWVSSGVRGIPGVSYVLDQVTGGSAFGGGASPAASVAGSPVGAGSVLAPVNSSITINVPTTATPEDIAGHVQRSQDAWWDSKMQNAFGGTD